MLGAEGTINHGKEKFPEIIFINLEKIDACRKITTKF
jgi:hypothetical protein